MEAASLRRGAVVAAGAEAAAATGTDRGEFGHTYDDAFRLVFGTVI